MRKQLDSTLAAAAAAMDAGTAADAALTVTQAAQHTIALHTLSAVLAAESAAACGGGGGGLGAQLAGEGVLGAVLESLGAGTPLRLRNAPAVVRQSLRLTEAHFLFIQVRPAARALRVPVSRCCVVASWTVHAFGALLWCKCVVHWLAANRSV